MFVVHISQLFSISWLENTSIIEKKKRKEKKRKEVCCWLVFIERSVLLVEGLLVTEQSKRRK